MTPRWTVAPSDRTAVTVAGPGLDDLVHYVADALAESIHCGDSRAQSWTDYLIARANLINAMDYGIESVGLEHLEEAVADAWDALAPDLASTIQLGMAEARMLAGQLNEAAGRIGTVTG